MKGILLKYIYRWSGTDPTSFARYNEDGVWVPRTYTGTYGNNGFHLDFADSSDLGNDVSGNKFKQLVLTPLMLRCTRTMRQAVLQLMKVTLPIEHNP